MVFSVLPESRAQNCILNLGSAAEKPRVDGGYTLKQE